MKMSMKKVMIVPVVFACLVLFIVFIHSGNELSGTYESESGSKTISFTGKTVTLKYDYGAESRNGSYLISVDQIKLFLNSDNGEEVKAAYFSDEKNIVTIDGEHYTLLREQGEREREDAEIIRSYWKDGDYREKWMQNQLELAERFIRESEETSGVSTITQVQEQNTAIEAQRQSEQILVGIADEMVLVNGGIFMMGCAPENEINCWEKEEPAHTVSLSDFYIGKYEVTQAQWKAVMGDNPSAFKGDDLPVEMVSWEDVQEFIRKLNATTRKNYRLPTEAEWEFAARGGTKSKGYKYSGSDDLDEVAWHSLSGIVVTHRVGIKNPNELGIFDMNGNVYEWINDRFGDYTSDMQENPLGPSTGSQRVIRGGSIIDKNMTYFWVWRRNGNNPWYPFIYTGFRLAHSTD